MRVNYLGLVLAVSVLVSLNAISADISWPRMATSADGIPISYEVVGSGEPTLVLIHGWSCDGRYWREQIGHFSDRFRVVVIDLAGHGHSGLGRDDYTMAAFGADVEAVVDDLGAHEVILVGHSMGGPVSVAAAGNLSDRVIGIVGIDTFQDVGRELNREEFEAWMAPLEGDFRGGARQFVAQMFVDATDPMLRDWIIDDMSAAPAKVALSAMAQMLDDIISGEALSALERLEVPVVAINADLWPTNVEANQAHFQSFEAVIIEGADHFLHMARPSEFNLELEQVIDGMLSDP
jgi:pimeloyl-ACP methyl ester carboxylesterase